MSPSIANISEYQWYKGRGRKMFLWRKVVAEGRRKPTPQMTFGLGAHAIQLSVLHRYRSTVATRGRSEIPVRAAGSAHATAASADVSFMVNCAKSQNVNFRCDALPPEPLLCSLHEQHQQVVQVGVNRRSNGLLQRTQPSRSAGRRRGSTTFTRPQFRSRYKRSSRRSPSVDSLW